MIPTRAFALTGGVTGIVLVVMGSVLLLNQEPRSVIQLGWIVLFFVALLAASMLWDGIRR